MYLMLTGQFLPGNHRRKLEKFEAAIIAATNDNIPSSFKSSRYNLPWMSRHLKRSVRRKHMAGRKVVARYISVVFKAIL